MATKTLLTIEQYAALDEPVGVRYELSQGDLIVTPSASYFHNDIRDRFNARLRAFLDAYPCGNVISEMDMRLGADTVRRPDIAFIREESLEGIDLERVPLPIAPDLAIEIVSKNDRADDLILKVSQYLQAGVQAVWLFYPSTQLAYRYVPGKPEPEVRSAKAGDRFEESELLKGFSLPLSEILK
ncbi:MAG: Uma2 family endonuclease [Terriglobia bacterium]|jgi:Uma2 family endonuclease